MSVTQWIRSTLARLYAERAELQARLDAVDREIEQLKQ